MEELFPVMPWQPTDYAGHGTTSRMIDMMFFRVVPKNSKFFRDHSWGNSGAESNKRRQARERKNLSRAGI